MMKIIFCLFLVFGLPLGAAASSGFSWNSLQKMQAEAREGNPAAQGELGVYYLLAGEGDRALPWLKKAVKKGDSWGLYGLGFCYETGLCGEEINTKKALAYYKKSARKKNPNSLYKIARLLQKDPKARPAQVLAGMRRAAENGSEPALWFLAETYFTGKEPGISQDYEQAGKYWGQLAQRGDALACLNMGTLYDNGYGVPKDFRQAFEWYLQAAQAGLPEGMFQVGQAYKLGKGVSRDPVLAAQWLEKASALGIKAAQKALAPLDKSL